jgi:2',3'-cyclic-nucleotide 2'-phosphodiesterase (5'-nucleotidase family)
MAMGNRESHPFRRALERKLRDASFPVLAANIRFRRGADPPSPRLQGTGEARRREGESRKSRFESPEHSRIPNLESRPFDGPETIRSHVLLSVPGARVGVIGFAPQMVRPSSLWARVTDYVFEDPMEIAPELAARLREDADLVVCLSHCREETNRELAALPEVDLVLAGHSHRAGVAAEPGCALIVYPGRYGSHVAKTELTSRTDARSELIPLERGR